MRVPPSVGPAALSSSTLLSYPVPIAEGAEPPHGAWRFILRRTGIPFTLKNADALPMILDEFLHTISGIDLGTPGTRRMPPRDNVREVQRLLANALKTADFVADCILADVAAWQAWQSSGWRGIKPPITEISCSSIYVRMFFWPAGAAADPHEHTSWTVSSVFYNELDVQTYDWEQTIAQRSVVPKNQFRAARGQVGYIYEPCIHSPRNASGSMTTSLHLIHTDDHPWLERNIGPIAGLTTYDDSNTTTPESAARRDTLTVAYQEERARALGLVHDEVLATHVQAMSHLPSTRTVHVLEELYRAGGRATRAAVAAAATDIPGESGALMRQLRDCFGD